VDKSTGHEHSVFVGRDMRMAERYPLKLLTAILAGLRLQLRVQRDGCVSLSALDVGIHLDEPEPELEDFHWQDSTQLRFYDDRTGFELDADLVRQARRIEMDFMGKLRVWDIVTIATCQEQTGRGPIGTRWVDTDKGDEQRPDIRCRIVVQETRSQSTIAKDDVGATFAATPPLECLRLVCSLVISTPAAKDHVIRFLDISRAHPHCKIRRLVFIRLPAEDPNSADKTLCGKLNMALYGTRDAGQNFEFEVNEVVTAAGCLRGDSCPCVFRCEQHGIYFFHHGDDFVIGGRREGSLWLVRVLETKFIVKDRGVLGPRVDDKEYMVCLNRMLRWRRAGADGGEAILYEADARHGELLRSQMGLDLNSRGLSAPGVQIKITPDVMVPLDEERQVIFRSACMRLSYLALDRADLQFVSKECARGMATPLERHWQLLKHAARYTITAPRLVWEWRRQQWPTYLDGYGDTDWAGCPITRRSSSCMVFMLGAHALLTAASTQVPLALSSGEAEFYGAVKTASRLLGLKSLLVDFGVTGITFRLWSDSSAARGVLARRGCGKIRHLETQALWVQKATQDKLFVVGAVLGVKNCADIGTKFLTEACIRKHLTTMRMTVVQATDKHALRARLG
jgi:hypothetical protein